MDEQQSGLSTGLRILFGFIALLLCSGTGLIGFQIGRQTAPEPASVDSVEAVDEEISAIEVTREVEREVTVEVTRQISNGSDATTSNGEAADEGPEAEDGDASQAPLPTPTFAPGVSGEFDEQDLEILFEAWQIIEENYDGEIPNDEQLRNALISYAVSTLQDDFSIWLPPDVAERRRDSFNGEFEGIGAYVDVNDDGVFYIVRPISNTPAERAGLLAGDLVIAVDGLDITGMLVDEIIPLVRGPRGEPVVLTIVREGTAEPFDVTIIRDRIVVPFVEAEMLEGDIAYVRLLQFVPNAEVQTVAALEQLLDQGATGIILDLRDNPGGLLSQSIAISDIFLPEGIVLIEQNNSGLDETFRSDDGDIGEDIPLVILVSPNSASASEIVAGAIQDLDRGVIIGEVTFGKGTVQTVRELSDGSELRVTIARWFTPDGNTIQDVGITPDIIIETPVEFGGEDDLQLQRAIEYLRTGE